MHHLETSIDIEASAARVWALLMDFPNYGRWNPFVRSIEGDKAAGGRLKIFVQPPGAKGMRFESAVIACEPERELRWKGKLLVRGLFDGEHYFRISPGKSRGVTFEHGEVFTGFLVPLFRSTLDGATKDGFVAMNNALKREAEKGNPLPR